MSKAMLKVPTRTKSGFIGLEDTEFNEGYSLNSTAYKIGSTTWVTISRKECRWAAEYFS
jgi:hypothetical protein